MLLRIEGLVLRTPYTGVDGRIDLGVGRHRGDLAVDGLPGDRDGDLTRDRPQLGEAGVDRPISMRSVGTREARVCAATKNMRSVTSKARLASAPSPTPGNTKTLLAWPTTWVRPSNSTGSKGLPVATTARPSLQASTSAGMASEFAVGLDKGKMIGLCVRAAISRTAASLNAPGWPLVPMRIVGDRCRTTLSRS